LERAAELSDAQPSRGRRLGDAAEAAWAAGNQSARAASSRSRYRTPMALNGYGCST
jgi:hypothetical protein